MLLLHIYIIHHSDWHVWGRLYYQRWTEILRWGNNKKHGFLWDAIFNPLRNSNGDLTSLRWRHNDHAGVSNHQPHGCLLNRLFRRKSKKTSKLRVTGLCAGNSPGTGEFPAQMASSAENVSIWWRHHDLAAVEVTVWLTNYILSISTIWGM